MGRGAREWQHWVQDPLSSPAHAVLSAPAADPAEEEAVPGLPGVSLMRPGPLTGYTSLLRQALNGAGRGLQAAGARSLGELVLRSLDAQLAGGGEGGAPPQPSAARLVEELAEVIPGFADACMCRGRQVNRLAGWLVGSLPPTLLALRGTRHHHHPSRPRRCCCCARPRRWLCSCT